MPSREELKMLQSLPLDVKIQKTRNRIREWVEEFGEDGVYVSFSGGKDSTVLLDIVRKDYPNIEAVFVNTGLEYPSVRKFALSKDNVTELRPEMDFRDVIIKYGYPVIGKRQARYIHDLQTAGEHNKNTVNLRITGFSKNGTYCPFMKLPKKYLPFKNAPFFISDQCCDEMKKKPMKKIQNSGRNPIMATMTEESSMREKGWKQYGCNAFELKYPRSAPMSFWTENDVLQYIHENKLLIANAYGQVVRDWRKDGLTEGQIDYYEKLAEIIPNYELPNHTYKTTGCKRTGCIFCMFGINQDKNRFVRLAEQEPKLCDYVMRGGEFFYRIFDRKGSEIKLKNCTHKQIEKWCVDNANKQNFKIENTWQPSKNGLGYWFVLEWLNEHGDLGIGIPNRKYYYEKYNNEETEKYLSMAFGAEN